MADVSFKNEDGTARNTPRELDVPAGTDTKDGSVTNPTEVVDVSALQHLEDAVKEKVDDLLHPNTPTESEPTNV